MIGLNENVIFTSRPAGGGCLLILNFLWRHQRKNQLVNNLLRFSPPSECVRRAWYAAPENNISCNRSRPPQLSPAHTAS
jgi:hypothetical protein